MNKKISLLLCSLLSITQLACAKDDRKLIEKIDLVEQVALNQELQRSKARSCCGGPVSSCFTNPDSICCKRGKRGKRGHRGHDGVATSGGFGEVLINAPMMCWFGQGILPDAIVIPYDNSTVQGTNIPTWTLYPSTEFVGNPPVGANFNVPVDLDITKPVTAVIHMLVDSSTQTGNQAAIQVQADYQPVNGLLGSVSPATGLADTENSADFTIVSATPTDSANMIQTAVSVSLDPTKMTVGDWAFITVGRIAPAANEYSGTLYLSTISIQYNRLAA